MGPEIIAVIVIASVVGGGGTAVGLRAGFKKMTSKSTTKHHEHDVEVTTTTEQRPDGTIITTTTRKGHEAFDASAHQEVHTERAGSEAIEAGFGKAIGALPSIVTAGASEAGGLLEHVTDVIGSAVASKDEDNTLPKTSTAVSLREAIAEANKQQAAKLQAHLDRIAAMQAEREAAHKAELEMIREEQAARDAEQEAEIESLRSKLHSLSKDLDSEDRDSTRDDASSSASDSDVASLADLVIDTALHHRPSASIAATCGSEPDLSAFDSAELTEEALAEHDHAVDKHEHAIASLRGAMCKWRSAVKLDAEIEEHPASEFGDASSATNVTPQALALAGAMADSAIVVDVATA